MLQLSRFLDMDEAARAYAKLPGIAWAEPARQEQAAFTPNDQYFSTTGAWKQSYPDLWGVKNVHAPQAWDTTRGAGTVVAVVDTGLDANHPDMQGRVWTNPGEIPGNHVDDDGNGYVDDTSGWDFVNNDNVPFDDHGHGTHVSGIIAADGNNNVGVVGVAFESKIMPLKGLDSGGGGTSDELAAAILYAADNGADVINASWGGTGHSQVIDDAISTAHAEGTVFVAAAGNSNVDVTSSQFFPASNPLAITVSAVDHLDQRASFSNFGAKIDVAAPGGGDSGSGFDPFRSVLSLKSSGAGTDMTGNGKLVVGSGYLRQAGTSMAAPFVAGAAADVLAAHPGYTPGQVRQALRAGADDVGAPGVDTDTGYGRLNIARSVSLDVLDAEITSPAPGATLDGDTLSIRGSAGGANFANYRVEYGAGAFPTSWTPITGAQTTPVNDGELASWDIGSVIDGTYTVRLLATNNALASFESRATITLDRQTITAPTATSMQRPTGPIAVTGTAGGGLFQKYRVEWRVTTPDFVSGSWRSDNVTLAGGGNTRVHDGLLATFNPTFTQNSDVDFRLVITRTDAFQVAKETRHVVLDPTLRPGWPIHIPGLPNFGLHGEWLENVTVADVDHNGSQEIITAYGDMVYVFQADGSLLPGWPQQIAGGTPGISMIRRAPAVADLDGDGKLEIVASMTEGLTYEGRGDIYIWHSDGTFLAGWPKEINQSYGRDPNGPEAGSPRGYFALTDVNGDGKRDIVAVIGSSLVVLDTNGNMLPGWPQRWPQPHPCLISDILCYDDVMAVGDVDHDGKKEIAIVGTLDQGADPEYLLLYNSTGQMMPGFPKKITNQHYGMVSFVPRLERSGGVVNSPAMGDIDGDGYLDIVVMQETKSVEAFNRVGKAIALPSMKGTTNKACSDASMPPMNEQATLGDLNGDGRAEVFVGVHARNWKWKEKSGRFTFWECPANVKGPDFLYALERAGGEVVRVGPQELAHEVRLPVR